MKNFDFKSFGIGLLIGLIVAIIVSIVLLIKKSIEKRNAKKQIDELKGTLANRMDIESAGVHQTKTDLDALKKENENMRITLSTLDQKAGRKEIRQLQVYQMALEKLMVTSPGFAPAWQTALQEAESTLKESQSGKIPFLGRFLPSKNPSIPIEDKSSDN